ncbi:SDR family oxidoreductase [Phenylobacterium sp.]|uniref:SDR family NAD(P)-dependent oxidoreductase n=1 Tax=Phenylobacterium sp. TaxID=1871053 RepID=UPI00301C8F13
MPGRLQGRTALITGATSGIGEATARLFHAEGANVAVVGRSQARGEAIVASFGDRGRFIQADVRHEAAIAGAIAETVATFGTLDVLFNNAGGPTGGDVETVTEAQYRDAVDLLFGSVVFGMKHAAPILKAKGAGAIINNSSIAALRCHMGGYLYSATKAAVTHVTRLAGMALGRYGVTVNSISPGGIVTPIFLGGADRAEAMAPDERAQRLQDVAASIETGTPLLRAGFPDVIASAALYLASDEGRFVNCHDLVVDAGLSAGGRTRYAS